MGALGTPREMIVGVPSAGSGEAPRNKSSLASAMTGGRDEDAAPVSGVDGFWSRCSDIELAPGS